MIDYSFNEIVIPTFGNFRKDCRSKWELILESLKRCSRNKMKAGKKEKEHRRATGDTFPMMHLGQTGYRCSHMISKFMITLHVASLQLTRHFNIIQKNLTISGKKLFVLKLWYLIIKTKTVTAVAIWHTNIKAHLIFLHSVLGTNDLF